MNTLAIKPEFKMGKHMFIRAANYPSRLYRPEFDYGVLLGFHRPDGGFDYAKSAIMAGWLIDVSGHIGTLMDDIHKTQAEIYRL